MKTVPLTDGTPQGGYLLEGANIAGMGYVGPKPLSEDLHQGRRVSLLLLSSSHSGHVKEEMGVLDPPPTPPFVPPCWSPGLGQSPGGACLPSPEHQPQGPSAGLLPLSALAELLRRGEGLDTPLRPLPLPRPLLTLATGQSWCWPHDAACGPFAGSAQMPSGVELGRALSGGRKGVSGHLADAESHASLS